MMFVCLELLVTYLMHAFISCHMVGLVDALTMEKRLLIVKALLLALS